MDSTKIQPPEILSPAKTATNASGTTNPIAMQTAISSVNSPGSGEERRRSQRVLLRVHAAVHVVWQGKPTTYNVTTVNVNVHGALILMNQSLPVETRLVLEHCGTRERMSCRVVRPARETPDGFHTALEFDSLAPDFWKITFPPTNWRPEDY